MFDVGSTTGSYPDRRLKPWAGPRERRVAPAAGPRERRMQTRAGALREGAIHVEALDMSAARIHRGDWARLAARAAEPNPFFEPDFVLPAARQLAAARRPTVLIARKRIDGRMRMIGALPLAPAGRFATLGPARAWRDPLAPLGAPLLDRDYAVEAFSAFLAWVGERRPLTGSLALHLTPRTGPAAKAIRQAAQARAADCLELDESARGALHAGAALDQMISSRRRKMLARLRRRLAERGAVSTRVSTGAAVEHDMEVFFELEASGWKGRRGTALASSIRTLALARAFLRSLSLEDRCSIAWLELDGAPIAAAVLVHSGGTAFYWKIAYDERYAAYSPGAQLMLDLSRRLLADPDFAMADSCSMPGSVGIEAIWKGRRRVTDLLIGKPGLGFAVTGEIELARRGLRAGAKGVYRKVAGLVAR
ncbi:MAG: GNAT family N-acetyltransferase [Methylobacteriaceae bacterium]|nr:GNAT family N-acetyltransferase [Methylobacteriaceae bacterium]